ncbi:hypothetical protein [uncultured Cohaesibacter sp.]|uniref:hypothetical protein n=1 Tax=uncultured Cohaesibacter sp. TaxID=1002546 RepID=UPI0029C65810|nr:hypothetical protein [uncultured Cohaesibacter sp.]
MSLDSQPEELVEWARQLALSEKTPDGIICPGETSYFALISGFAAGGKVRGRDYHAVAKSVSSVIRMQEPPVDHIIEDVREAGFLMGKHLLELMNEDNPGPRQTLQQPELRFVDV